MLKNFVEIADLDLNNRLFFSLAKAGYNTVGDILTGLKSGKIYKVRGVGEKSIADLISVMEVQENEVGQFFKVLIDSDLHNSQERILTCKIVDKKNTGNYEVEFMMRKKMKTSNFVLYKKPYTVFPYKETFFAEAVKKVIGDLDNLNKEG